MSTPILTTKLFIPQPPTDLVPRRPLIERLTQGLDRKLTLVSAPAGYGKTTLISEWSARNLVPFCWLTLDDNDNDISRFLAYIIASLQTIEITVEEKLIAQLAPPQEPEIESILIPLINQITNSNFAKFVLVLDDYQVIQNREIHWVLTFLLDHQPPAMHLVIITRSDPPVGLARLRGRGHLTEIRAADLRFSVQEGENLLNRIGRLNLNAEEIASLLERTDGWVTALQLITLASATKQDSVDYIQDFSGSQTYIAEYLTDEVINQQPAYIQDFLLKTSILKRLSGEACDAVLSRENSQQVLEQLRNENLFLNALDNSNQWFRYHQLFANLLQQRLAITKPDSVPDLYINASNWFDDNGYPNEAIEYALQGKHTQHAADLIEHHAILTISRSEVNTFIYWTAKLPEEVVCQKPLLCILFAWAVLVTDGETQTAREYLSKVTAKDTHTSGQLKTIQAVLEVFTGNFREAIELCREALAQLPKDDHFFRIMAAWNMSGALAVKGEVEAGMTILQQVVDASIADQNYLVSVIALCRQGMFHAQMGNLHHAKDLFEQAINISTADQPQPIPAASEAFMGAGKVYWEWNQLDSAREYLLASLTLSKRWREFTVIDSYVTLAHLEQTQGRIADANLMMAKAYSLAVESTNTKSDDIYVACQQAHLAIRQGNLNAAQVWAARRGLEKYIRDEQLVSTGQTGRDVILLYELIVYARLLFTEGQLEDAKNILNLVSPTIKDLGYTAKIIETQILTAVVKYALGDASGSISALKEAINAAQLEGYIRLFLDDRSSLAAPLQELITQGYSGEFAAALKSQINQPTIQTESTPTLIEPLTERELEILSMLRTELSAPEIADHLHIAVTTMRTHTKNIYSKLGVHSRFEAVTKAEELNLLS